jgi:hypothetical protein
MFCWRYSPRTEKTWRDYALERTNRTAPNNEWQSAGAVQSCSGTGYRTSGTVVCHRTQVSGLRLCVGRTTCSSPISQLPLTFPGPDVNPVRSLVRLLLSISQASRLTALRLRAKSRVSALAACTASRVDSLRTIRMQHYVSEPVIA